MEKPATPLLNGCRKPYEFSKGFLYIYQVKARPNQTSLKLHPSGCHSNMIYDFQPAFYSLPEDCRTPCGYNLIKGNKAVHFISSGMSNIKKQPDKVDVYKSIFLSVKRQFSKSQSLLRQLTQYLLILRSSCALSAALS